MAEPKSRRQQKRERNRQQNKDAARNAEAREWAETEHKTINQAAKTSALMEYHRALQKMDSDPEPEGQQTPGVTPTRPFEDAVVESPGLRTVPKAKATPKEWPTVLGSRF